MEEDGWEGLDEVELWPAEGADREEEERRGASARSRKCFSLSFLCLFPFVLSSLVDRGEGELEGEAPLGRHGCL